MRTLVSESLASSSAYLLFFASTTAGLAALPESESSSAAASCQPHRAAEHHSRPGLTPVAHDVVLIQVSGAHKKLGATALPRIGRIFDSDLTRERSDPARKLVRSRSLHSPTHTARPDDG